MSQRNKVKYINTILSVLSSETRGNEGLVFYIYFINGSLSSSTASKLKTE